MYEITLLKRIIAQERSGGLSQTRACDKVARELDPMKWSRQYVMMLIGEDPPNPSNELKAAIRRVYRKRTKEQAAKRFWLKVEAESQEEKDAWIRMIPMERRRELFREEIERQNKASDPNVIRKLSQRVKTILTPKKTIK
ncbi:hypothetical protein KQH40_00615 [bacterium]|nr:hypothetical protein [bacterium]